MTMLEPDDLLLTRQQVVVGWNEQIRQARDQNRPSVQIHAETVEGRK